MSNKTLPRVSVGLLSVFLYFERTVGDAGPYKSKFVWCGSSVGADPYRRMVYVSDGIDLADLFTKSKIHDIIL